MMKNNLEFLAKAFEGHFPKIDLLEVSQNIPYPTLLVYPSAKAEELFTLTYFPPEATEFEHIQCLQVFTRRALGAELSSQNAPWLFLAELNRKLPFGSINIDRLNPGIEFRHIITQDFNSPPQVNFFLELIQLSVSMVELFLPLLRALNEGTLSLEEALEKSPL